EGKTKITSWTMMKNKLMAKFLPVHYRQEAFINYHRFRQGTSMSVEDFTGEFDRLRMRCGVDEEEEQTVARYLASLRHVVHLQQYWSYNDACLMTYGPTSEKDFGPVFDECGDEAEENVFYQEEITYADSGEALVVR
nr:reverse transcriptase domain-containing protein [Tanacetum cinerariifolium]